MPRGSLFCCLSGLLNVLRPSQYRYKILPSKYAIPADAYWQGMFLAQIAGKMGKAHQKDWTLIPKMQYPG